MYVFFPMKSLFISIIVLFSISTVMFSKSPIKVDDRLPAGNIVFEKVVNDTVYIHQDLRGAEKDWFYWAFRVRGAQGRKLTFVFTKSDVVGFRGPVVSVDKGKTKVYPSNLRQFGHGIARAIKALAEEE